MNADSGLVSFNVGGRRHQLFVQTLGRHADSLLAKLAKGQLRGITDAEGSICIDRDPDSFGLVLSFLRYGRLPLDTCRCGLFDLLLDDCDFYNLPQLKAELLQMRDTEEAERRLAALPPPSGQRQPDPNIVSINVGGTQYTTSLSTISRYPDSMLGAMFSDRFKDSNSTDWQSCPVIDRDGALFRHVLNFMRTGQLRLPVGFAEGEALLAEAEFYQIQPLIHQLRRWLGGSSSTRAKGVYLEVKDNVVCFRGFHITTSLTGPLAFLKSVPPFDAELAKLPQTPPLLSPFSTMPFYTAWIKGNMEEVYLNSDASKSRLEWASLLRATGWRLCSTSSCCSSNSDQTFIVVDKWFLPSDQLYDRIFAASTDAAGQPASGAGANQEAPIGVASADAAA